MPPSVPVRVGQADAYMSDGLDEFISLAHGNGGRLMRELIDKIFVHHLGNPELDVTVDAASLTLPGNEIVMSTDGFTVEPLEFPGGDIGSLAVHGTVNDLAVSGATPLFLSLNAFIEEGFEIDRLDRLIASLAVAARAAGVRVVTGDTKVLRRGEGGGLYLATTGIGHRAVNLRLGLDLVKAGDAILVSGPVGDHGVAVMLAREEFGWSGPLRSDSACVLDLTQAVLDMTGLRFLRDPTRGGLGTVAHEIAAATGLDVRLIESAIPVSDPVHAVCELLGYDPFCLACEGRVVMVIDAAQAEQALAVWRALPSGKEAAIIGHINEPPQGRHVGAGVTLRTLAGGERILDELEDDPLPRIC